MGAWIHRPLPLRLRHYSPSASVADLPASAIVPSHTLPLYSISLAEPHRGDSPTSPSSSSPSFPPPFFHSVTKTERRRRPLLPLHPITVDPFPLPPPIAKTSPSSPPFLCPLQSLEAIDPTPSPSGFSPTPLLFFFPFPSPWPPSSLAPPSSSPARP